MTLTNWLQNGFAALSKANLSTPPGDVTLMSMSEAHLLHLYSLCLVKKLEWNADLEVKNAWIPRFLSACSFLSLLYNSHGRMLTTIVIIKLYKYR